MEFWFLDQSISCFLVFAPCSELWLKIFECGHIFFKELMKNIACLKFIVVVDVILFDKCVSLYIENLIQKCYKLMYLFLPFQPLLGLLVNDLVMMKKKENQFKLNFAHLKLLF